MNLENLSVCEEKLNFGKKFFVCVCVIALLTRPVSSAFVWNSTRDWKIKDRISKVQSPEFEKTDTRIVVLAGRDAILPCRVNNLNDKVVSWIRTRDLHIITSGSIIFTADERFQRAHGKGSSDWSLRLRNAKDIDSGIYDCQVNTDPKMNRKVTLDVVSDFEDLSDSSNDLYMVDDEGITNTDSMTRILGQEEQFVKAGSTITFTCLVMIPGETVTSIDWLRNGRLISFQASRGGIIVETEKSDKKATSRLTLANVEPRDTGNYTCKPVNAKSHSISLVVLEGEHTQAMQRNSNGSQKTPVNKFFVLSVVLLNIIIILKLY